MQQNYQSYESLQNTNNSLDINPYIKYHRPKTMNTNEQSSEKKSFNGTSISSNTKTKENDSYNNFISRIKLNYNLQHPRQRIQTIILHSNLDKSLNMSNTSIQDLKSNDISSNNDDNLNTGFILDNSGSYINNHNRRRTINHLNRVYDERLQKGEEEKNNQSAKTKKNKPNLEYNKDLFNNMEKNTRINLGSFFNEINNNDQKDKIFLSQNGFNDDKIWTNEQKKDITKKPDNNNYYSYNHENNPFLGQNWNQQQINEKGLKYMNRNYISDMNNLSTNMNTNNTDRDIFRDGKIENDKKEMISSFNYGISNTSLPNPRNSYFNLGNNPEEINNKINNDNIELDQHFTFYPKEKQFEENNYNSNTNKSSLYSFSQNNPNTNNFNNNNENNNYTNQEDNKSRINHLIHNQKEMNKEDNIDVINNNNQGEDYEQNKIYGNNKSKNIRLNFVEKGSKSNIEENNYNINKESEINSNISLTVSESDESALEQKKKSKGKNLCKSFLYGLLFGSTASGIFWLKNEETRNYFFEKIKGINFNSIINMLKAIFSNPVEFFRKIFSNERMKDYLKVIGLTLGKFFDIFESYDDWFRLIGIFLSVYLVWIIIKSFIKVFFKVWKYYN